MSRTIPVETDDRSRDGGRTRKGGGKLVHEGPDASALLTVDDVAALLNCSSRTVRRLADTGTLPVPMRLNSLLRWRRSDIEDFIAGGCGSCRPSREGQQMTDPSKVSYVRLSDIKPSPENDQLYRPVDPDDPGIIELARSIMLHGIREPIVVTEDNRILSGHRRYAACQRLGMELVPVRVEPIRREDDIDGFVVLLREYNRQREKSFDEKLREELLDVNPEEAYREVVDFREKSDHLDTEAFEIIGKVHRKRISSPLMPFLHAVESVVDDLRPFWPVSVRQIHYGLLNAPPLTHSSKPGSAYSNTPAAYKKLVDLVTRARLDGTIPFAAIEDETRPVTVWDVFPSTQPFVQKQVNGLMKGYYRDLQISQPDHVELVIEKNTLSSILKPVAGEFCIPMTSGRGFCSLKPRYDIAQRFQRSGKNRLVLVIVSDFDPDGEEISQSLARSMRDDFGIENIYPIKAALTRDQTQSLNLPKGLKAKPKSKNYDKFCEANNGDDCWEVESLSPLQLQELVRDAIEGIIDIDLLNQEIAQEKRDAQHLFAVRNTITKSLGKLDFSGEDFD
jgi:excisionase family DNA binding protein